MQALRLVDTKTIDHDEWLDWRKKGIGGSDVAGICGFSRYSSAVQVYLDKIGKLPPKEENAEMKAGKKMEPLLADWFAEETGKRVMKQNAIFQHKKHPFMLANIDRWVIGENAGLEIKNTKEFCRQDWFDGDSEIIPTEYQLQANHYMEILGADRWYICVLIGGYDFQWRIIERDEKLIQNLITIEKDFWENHVMARVMPGFGSNDKEILDFLYPESKPASTFDISEHYYDLVMRLLKSKHNLEVVQEQFDTAKNEMKGLMGENEVAYWQNEKFCTWKSDKRGRRSFRLLGAI